MKKVVLTVFTMTALLCFIATSLPSYAGKKSVQVPADDGFIYGCYKKVNGQLRVVDGPESCRPSEGSISWKASETNCSDGVDNDNDTAIDCADIDCLGNPACVLTETNCSDGVDNDNDTAIDCVDADCVGNPACQAAQ